jgi:TonB family protein
MNLDNTQRASRRPRRLCLSLALASGLVASAVSNVGNVRADDKPAAKNAGPQLTKPPTLVTFVEAPYPAVEPRPVGDVAVVLQVGIGADGHVTDTSVAESGGAAFDAAAQAAVQAFVFTPAEVDGVVSPIRIVYRYVFTIREEKVVPTTGVLSGTVRDYDTKKPVPGVSVVLADGTRTLTDTDGRFRFEGLLPGKQKLTLSADRLTPLATEEEVHAGEELDVSYKVALTPPPGEQTGPADDLEILVTAPPALKREVVATKVSAEEARSIPGAQGDVVRVVENLPGVARSAVGSGQLVVWGASPEDTRTYVDGVPIPRLYHEGGLRSTVHSSTVKAVELVPGGYGAAYGRGLGGIVRIDTKTPNKPGLHGSVAGDVFDASGSLSSDLGTGARTRIAVAGRYSVVDRFADKLKSGIGDYVPIPTYRDGQARVTHELGDGAYVETVALFSNDRTSRGVPNPDPALVTRESRTLDFYRLYARYVKESGAGTRTQVTPFVGFGNQRVDNRFGATTTSLGRDDWTAGLRASHAARVTPWLNLEGGIDVEVTHNTVTRRGSLGLPAREGDVRVFGQPPPDAIAYDRFKTLYAGVAPYAEADIALFDSRLHIVPGLRVDPLLRSASKLLPQTTDAPVAGVTTQDFVLEPRLAIRWAALDRLTFHAATGIYHQPPQAQDLSASFGNPQLSPARSVHVVAGTAYKPWDVLSVELTGFLTMSDDLTMRNGSDAPRRAEALLASGEGKTYGLQTLIRRELANHVFGWVAYTVMRAERKNAPDAATRLFDFDQTHVLSTVLVWNPFTGFEVGGRFRLASGFPRTPVVDAYYDALRDRYQPVFGAQNSIRIPLFMQLDLRVSQAFKLGDTKLDVYVEVQNVTNRKNSEELVYSPTFQTRSSIRSFPILPVAGLAWTF